VKLNDAVKQRLNEIVSSQEDETLFGLSTVYSFYVLENIPEKKRLRAINTYIPCITSDEIAVLLFDETWFGSSKEGFMVTTEKFYAKSFFRNLFLYISGI